MMKHVEYGMKFTTAKMFGSYEKCIMPLGGEADELCVVVSSLYTDGCLPSIDFFIINPLNDLIVGNIASMDSMNTNPGTVIEFTPKQVLLKGGDQVLQSIPSEDFRQIIIEWRDFMNEPIEKDWRNRAPFKWFSFFWGDLNCI